MAQGSVGSALGGRGSGASHTINLVDPLEKQIEYLYYLENFYDRFRRERNWHYNACLALCMIGLVFVMNAESTFKAISTILGERDRYAVVRSFLGFYPEVILQILFGVVIFYTNMTYLHRAHVATKIGQHLKEAASDARKSLQNRLPKSESDIPTFNPPSVERDLFSIAFFVIFLMMISAFFAASLKFDLDIIQGKISTFTSGGEGVGGNPSETAHLDATVRAAQLSFVTSAFLGAVSIASYYYITCAMWFDKLKDKQVVMGDFKIIASYAIGLSAQAAVFYCIFDGWTTIQKYIFISS